jgi:C-terminal processing protease CtpA/Prc
LNREGDEFRVEESDHASVLQATDANGLRGKEVRLRFQAKVDRAPCDLQAWFEVAGESGEGMSEDMAQNPIIATEWALYELSGKVDKDAELLTFGFRMSGKGTCLIDDVRLEFKDDDEWFEIEIENAKFEDGEDEPEGWISEYDKFACLIESDDVAEGGQAMRIAAVRRVRPDGEESMYELPKLGEVVDAEICEGIRIRMPLTLSEEHRYERGDDEQTDSFVASVESFELPEDAKLLAVANVAIAWNIFQHFYPYFDQIDSDWDAALVKAIDTAFNLDNRESATRNLRWLVAQLHDGHGNVYDRKSRILIAPVGFGWVEDQLIVTASNDEKFKVGDIITKVDGQIAIDYLKDMEQYISGSPQWKRHRSTQQMSQGQGSKSLTIQRAEQTLELELSFKGQRAAAVDKGDVCRIEVDAEGEDDDIWYIDMGRAEPKDVDPLIQKLASAKGIVLDFRGYPRGTQYLFQHMTDQHMQSQKWQVPRQIRPNRTDMKNFETAGRWQMPPKQPRFGGKMVFITNGSAISYAESCMAIVANYKLGEIIGSPTAGANGNINPFPLPGGYRVSWTGMRVVNHDDSQHHVNGVAVTMPMEPTLAGIRDGRDELLEAAVDLIKDSQ